MQLDVETVTCARSQLGKIDIATGGLSVRACQEAQHEHLHYVTTDCQLVRYTSGGIHSRMPRCEQAANGRSSSTGSARLIFTQYQRER